MKDQSKLISCRPVFGGFLFIALLSLVSCKDPGQGTEKIPGEKPGVETAEVTPAEVATPPPVVEALDISIPAHFLSTNVEASYPTKKAIPKPDVITKAGGSVTIQAHSDYPEAQLRVIRLPKASHATEEAARALAESEAIQDGDIMLVFRPEWANFDSYCNIQLGLTHTAFCTIESEGGNRYVKSVENPLSYSCRLNHAEHYGGHELFHIIRPTLTPKQKENLTAWALRTLEAGSGQVSFYTDYGMPYQARKLGGKASGNLPVDLARSVIYPEKGLTVGTYCSEMVWALLALRDFIPRNCSPRFRRNRVTTRPNG